MLSYDDITFIDEYAVRDMNLLKDGRRFSRNGAGKSNIYIVQTSESCHVDPTLTNYCIWASKYSLYTPMEDK